MRGGGGGAGTASSASAATRSLRRAVATTRKSPSSTRSYRGKTGADQRAVLSRRTQRADRRGRSAVPRRRRAGARDRAARGGGARHCRSSIICSTSWCTDCCIFSATITRRTQEAQTMESLEVRILQRLGIADPYATAGEPVNLPEQRVSARSHEQRTSTQGHGRDAVTGERWRTDQLHTGPARCACAAASGLRSPTLARHARGRPQGRRGSGRRGGFSNEEREMLLRLLRFGGSRVDDIMVPRADIIALEESDAARRAAAHFRRGGRVAHPAVQRDAR